VRISLEALTTFSLIFESLVSSCMLAVVVQHQKLKRCIFHLLAHLRKNYNFACKFTGLVVFVFSYIKLVIIGDL